MWEAVKFVSSGLTLLAFMLAAAAWTYKGASERTLSLIETATEVDRSQLIRSALEVVDVDTTGLNNAQRYELAIALIRARAERFRITATVVCILALILGGVSVYAISRTNFAARNADTSVLSRPVTNDHLT